MSQALHYQEHHILQQYLTAFKLTFAKAKYCSIIAQILSQDLQEHKNLKNILAMNNIYTSAECNLFFKQLFKHYPNQKMFRKTVTFAFLLELFRSIFSKYELDSFRIDFSTS